MALMKNFCNFPAIFFSFICILVHSNYAWTALLVQANNQANDEAKPKILTYDVAVGRTINQSINLSIAENEIQAKSGQRKQARLYPNPSLDYDIETSEFGWHDREELYAINQLVELGGKREKQYKMATNEYYAALSGYEASKLERLYQLAKNFIQTIAAQEFFKIAVEQQRNSEEFLAVTTAKFDAGKVSLIEKNKTDLTKSLSDLTVRQRSASFQTAKKNLAFLWGGSDNEFDAVDYPFYQTSPPPPIEDYLAKLCEQPEIVRSYYKYRAAFHSLRFERAVQIPDVTVTVGYSYDAGDNGIVAGVNIPLPIWNQNQGNIKKAKYEMFKTGNEGEQLWLTLEAKLSTAHIELVRNYHEAEDLKNTLLKTADQAYELALEGYKEGKFDYIDVLEAKRSLFEIREKYIEALVLYHTKLAEIEYLNSQTN